MNTFERQTLRAALGELQGDIKAGTTHPLALGKIEMISFLLAYSLAREGEGYSGQSIAGEVAYLQKAQSDEQEIVASLAQRQSARVAVAATELTAYLRARLGNSEVEVVEAQTLLGGISKETSILKLKGADQFGNVLVLRRDLEGGPVELKAADEFPIVHQMHERGIAVPRPLWADHSPPFPGTCMVMQAVPGKTVYDATGMKLGDNGQGAALGLARVLGRIHSTPVTELGLPNLNVNTPLRQHVEQTINRYEDQWQRRRTSASPTLTAAFDWLRGNVPETRDLSLVHGDASLRNLLVHEGRESALLDWELWHLGDHNEDLAYCKHDVEQFVPWNDFLSEYHAHGGRPVDAGALRFYGIFGALRNSVFAENLVHSYEHMPEPEPKFAYGALLGGRPLICGIAAGLSQA